MNSSSRDFKTLFEYNASMNRRMLELLRAQREVFDDCVRLLSHIVNAQAIWLTRLTNESSANNIVWEAYDLETLEQNLHRDEKNWQEFLDELTALEEAIRYTNTRGESFENTVHDILSHVVNHGTHHRAQISMLLRQKGVAPPATDYIVYRR